MGWRYTYSLFKGKRNGLAIIRTLCLVRVDGTDYTGAPNVLGLVIHVVTRLVSLLFSIKTFILGLKNYQLLILNYFLIKLPHEVIRFKYFVISKYFFMNLSFIINFCLLILTSFKISLCMDSRECQSSLPLTRELTIQWRVKLQDAVRWDTGCYSLWSDLRHRSSRLYCHHTY